MLVRKIIRLKSLEVGVRFILTDNINRTVKQLKKEGYTHLEPDKVVQGVAGYCDVKGLTTFYCIIQIEESFISSLKITAHELYHITQDVLEFKEIKFKKGDANEIYAYTYDYLIGEAYPILVKTWTKKYGKK